MRLFLFLGLAKIAVKRKPKMTPSKYILNNVKPSEKLVEVLSSSKGLFNSMPDIAVTTERIFARYENDKSFSFPLNKIKNIEVVPDKGLFGREKNRGIIKVVGPYNKEILIRSENISVDAPRIRRLLTPKD